VGECLRDVDECGVEGGDAGEDVTDVGVEALLCAPVDLVELLGLLGGHGVLRGEGGQVGQVRHAGDGAAAGQDTVHEHGVGVPRLELEVPRLTGHPPPVPAVGAAVRVHPGAGRFGQVQGARARVV